MSQSQPVRGAVIGYGGAFNMGKGHLNWMKDAGMIPTAACDVDPTRVEAAKGDFEDIRTYTKVSDLLADPNVDLVTIITPHNTHAELAVQVANAGKHVVCEKPMCITAEEATQMIDAAKKNNVTLSIFHNRRHDGDFLTIKDLIDKGTIGNVFQIQAGGGGYNHPGTWWRANKAISGGLMYDWGAHFIDWILNLKHGHKVTQVTGFLQKKVWLDQTNEDHGQIIIRFDDGCAAELTQSNISGVPMPRWRILGDKGGILDDGTTPDAVQLFARVGDIPVTANVPHKKTEWNTYYKDLGAYFAGTGPLDVTGESARRVIAVIEAAEKSAKSGKSESVPYE